MIYIKENDFDHNIMCDVCLDDVVEKDEDGVVTDHLVICDRCNVAVHQSCYGRELQQCVPKGDWYCERCRSMDQYKVS